MGLLALVLIVLVVLTAGYLLYGTLIARQYRLDDSAVTPATAKNDGVDFVPTRPFYLLGQHFSAIAAAGPIVGPVAACMVFGWGPCVLWILLGVIFIGAVHDFSALVASVRHEAHSIAEIARQHLGRRAYVALAAFIWLALLYVILAFTDVTASTFVGVSEELEGMKGSFNKGGAVAAASVMYLAVALVMGFVQRFVKPPMWVLTAVFVPATLGVIWLGTRVSTLGVFNHDAFTWQCAILLYCFVASLLPMWTLQQPRGYLGGFVLYVALAVGLVGILIGGFEIRQPAFKEGLPGLGAFFGGGGSVGADGAVTAITPAHLLFPFLFVTIACGACSGFHGLVCGGTTSKQIAKESHCKPVAFGAMLLEGLVAVIALATVMIAAPESLKGKNPAVIYGDGIAAFLTRILGDEARVFAMTFGTMAVATFVFDTLDVSTRLGRYLLQELFGAKGRVAGAVAAGATVGIPLLVLWGVQRGGSASGGGGGATWRMFWTLFGTSNQLLAGLTLLGITVWLRRTGRRCWFALVPMVFVMGVTATALVVQVVAGWRAVEAGGKWTDPAALNALVGVALLGLAGIFVWEAARAVRRREGLAAGPA